MELVHALANLRHASGPGSSDRGLVAGVYGSRGGVGATFLSTHLAAALADMGRRAVLVDLDVQSADVTIAIGASGDDLRTIHSLLPVMEEDVNAEACVVGWVQLTTSCCTR